MDGILNINKSSGCTSFGVVSAVRKLCRERRVGHAGTLDPMATGVLPVCLGRATRVAEYLMEHSKEYRAEIEFGLTSDSGDADGTIVVGGDASGLDVTTVTSALSRFRGKVLQTPPMYSAIKRNGRPLYELARLGLTVDRPARVVEIEALDLVSWEPPVATIHVTCSRGTYVRSLASDLGDTLGCGAYLKSLCRLRYGPFEFADSVPLADLERAAGEGDWQYLVHPLDSALSHLPMLRVEPEVAEFIGHGRPFAPDALGDGQTASDSLRGEGRCRAYTLDGSFIGVLRFNSEKVEWRPEKVFR